MHQVQLSDQVYEQAMRHARKAGFKSVEEFFASLVLQREAEDAGKYDHRFTPTVIDHLNQLRAEVKAGAKTYTEEEVDEHLRQKAKAWLESHPS